MLQSGDIAPRFALPDADMEVFDLASAAGRHHVVLFFYPRDRTPSCTVLATGFSDREGSFARHDCIIIGISPDDSMTHAEFRDEEGLSIRLLSDTEKEVCQLYGVWQEKEVDGIRKMAIKTSTFVIDKEGVVRHAFYGVVPRGHAAAVFELVKELEPKHAKRNRQK